MGQSSTPLKWPANTELLGLCLELQPVFDGEVYPQYAIALHSWFLDQVRQTDPDLSAALHDNPEQKAFTISRLQGNLITEKLRVGVSAKETYRWSITALSRPVVVWMRQWVQALPETLSIREQPFKILRVTTELRPTTYTKLWKVVGPMEPVIALNFLSPTSFRSRGHHMPLPIPRNLFQSYLRRWNAFAKQKVEMDGFLDWVEQRVVIRRHQLSSAKTVAGKSGAVTGFVGTMEMGLELKGETDPNYLNLFKALGLYAPYCGTGHKTTFGLGLTREGWSEHWLDQPLVTVEDILCDRIAQLTDTFRAQRQRQGKDRATNTARVWATILARREIGDSLGEIAQDLEIPYETAKTYSKLARRALRED